MRCRSKCETYGRGEKGRKEEWKKEQKKIRLIFFLVAVIFFCGGEQFIIGGRGIHNRMNEYLMIFL
jgi:hypothetical protein